MLKYVLFHHNHQEKKERPQEDFCLARENIFIVADGITHDLIDGKYPSPSDSYQVAKIAAIIIYKSLKAGNKIKDSFQLAHKQIKKFQKHRKLYQNREKNNYTFGATTIAAAVVIKNKLIYGVLDDCSVAAFDINLNNRVKTIPYVKKSAEYLFSKHSWEDLFVRKVWRKQFRNHKVKIKDRIYGYGVLDGHGDYRQFLQTGQIKLKKGDLVCVYTDGFIKPLEDREFVKLVYHLDNKDKLKKYIEDCCRKNNIVNEKSCYFIKNINM